MKSLSTLSVAAVVACVLNVGLAAEPEHNVALLHSPRYLEEHPELLRAPSPSRTVSRTKLTENIALANSPRYREEHPELRWTASGAEGKKAQIAGDRVRSRNVTENKALLASPRYLEEHPELLLSQPEFQIAPLK